MEIKLFSLPGQKSFHFPSLSSQPSLPVHIFIKLEWKSKSILTSLMSAMISRNSFSSTCSTWWLVLLFHHQWIPSFRREKLFQNFWGTRLSFGLKELLQPVVHPAVVSAASLHAYSYPSFTQNKWFHKKRYFIGSLRVLEWYVPFPPTGKNLSMQPLDSKLSLVAWKRRHILRLKNLAQSKYCGWI